MGTKQCENDANYVDSPPSRRVSNRISTVNRSCSLRPVAVETPGCHHRIVVAPDIHIACERRDAPMVSNDAAA
jgi:hypothetical protein